MKSASVAIILLLACVGLGAGWFYQSQKAGKRIAEDRDTIVVLSNNLAAAESKLEQQQQRALQLQGEISQKLDELQTFNKKVVNLTENLAQVEAKAKAEAEATQAELAKRNAKINELESKRDVLTKEMSALNVSITGLEGRIAETERKLEASEGDREFLLVELKRLQQEKEDLERQFNDLAVLRDQVRKLKDELSIARRLDWIRRGFYSSSTVKGGERLQQGFEAGGETPVPSYDLNVELKQSGETSIAAPTNAPASTNSPGPQ